jgi:hypothetical protein
MKKIKEVEKVKRGRGRPKTNRPTKTNLLVIRLEDMEIEELKILQRDTKADTMTALIRNLITFGSLSLSSGASLKENEIFYQRFWRKWDGQKHLSMYSDDFGMKMKELEKELEKKNVNK